MNLTISKEMATKLSSQAIRIMNIIDDCANKGYTKEKQEHELMLLTIHETFEILGLIEKSSFENFNPEQIINHAREELMIAIMEKLDKIK